jgi:15,16-dihydrobiliverdin:ferredoxin oxidoreductase
MSLAESVRTRFPEWEETNRLPEGLEHLTTTSEGSEIRSYVWGGETIRRARVCELSIPGKFTAETLVIYPDWCTQTPILGTEYITIANKKFFGAIDFHPLLQTPEYLERWVEEYLYDFPERQTETSKFYDLSKYFSSRFWTKKSAEDFSEEYTDWADRYMGRYRMALMDGDVSESNRPLHVDYDRHMALNDPAHGILKSYFGAGFADFYVHRFLFDLSEG